MSNFGPVYVFSTRNTLLLSFIEYISLWDFSFDFHLTSRDFYIYFLRYGFRILTTLYFLVMRVHSEK